MQLTRRQILQGLAATYALSGLALRPYAQKPDLLFRMVGFSASPEKNGPATARLMRNGDDVLCFWVNQSPLFWSPTRSEYVPIGRLQDFSVEYEGGKAYATFEPLEDGISSRLMSNRGEILKFNPNLA